jgi:hypothetical protein
MTEQQVGGKPSSPQIGFQDMIIQDFDIIGLVIQIYFKNFSITSKHGFYPLIRLLDQ